MLVPMPKLSKISIPILFYPSLEPFLHLGPLQANLFYPGRELDKIKEKQREDVLQVKENSKLWSLWD